MTRPIKDLARSVHTRLLTFAKQTGGPFNELLQLYPCGLFVTLTERQYGMNPAAMVTARNSLGPMELVAVNVRRLRLAAKLTQAQLAKRAGLDRTFGSLCQRCQRNVTIQSLFALAPGLGCDPQQLVADPNAGGAVHRPEDAQANPQARFRRLGATRSTPSSLQRNGVRR